MSLGDFNNLVSSIEAWLNRADLTLRIPDFIRLAEARMNRLVRDPEQVRVASLTMANGASTLPSDFLEIIDFGTPPARLARVTIGEFTAYNPVSTDYPVFTIAGGTVMTKPLATGAVPITYYAAIPPLSQTSPTNWLLARAPDLYLRGSLLEAEAYGWNDERLPMIKAYWDETITEMRADGVNRSYGAGTLSPRIKRK